MRTYALIVSAALVMGCGGEGLTAPTAPTPQPITAPPAPAPLPPPPPTVATIAGSWVGTMRFQFTPSPGDWPGQLPAGMYAVEMRADIQQADRSITGSWHVTSPGNDIRGDISGVLDGAEATTTFNGTVTIDGETHSGTGRCRGTAAFSGSAWAGLNWQAPNGWDNRGLCYNAFSQVSWRLRAAD